MADFVYTEERIINRPEVEDTKESDYFLIDSPTLGMRCIKRDNLYGGGSDE